MHAQSRILLLACVVHCCASAARTEPHMPAPERKWVDDRTAGAFRCHADFPLAPYENLLAEMAGVQDDLVRTLGIQAAREPVELYLFRDKTVYRSYLQSRYPEVPYRRALFVKGKGPGRVYVFKSAELPVDVRHEGTHGLLHASLPMVPLWLDEGLAEFFEVPAHQRAYGNPHLAELKWNLRLGLTPRLASLEQKRDLGEMSAVDYRYAWAWVHFMLYGPREAHEELVAYLRDIQQSSPPGQLSERLERRLPGVEKRLVSHFRNWKSSERVARLTGR
jgi:hypothetical protein